MIFIALLTLEKLDSALFRYHKRRSKSLFILNCIWLFRQYEGLDELLTRSCDNTNPLITQLDMIDSVARLWLEMASHLNLNIFKGFKDERSLLNFALNINGSKNGDTSKVVAG